MSGQHIPDQGKLNEMNMFLGVTKKDIVYYTPTHCAELTCPNMTQSVRRDRAVIDLSSVTGARFHWLG